MKNSQKTALVTGAAVRVGKEIAITLAKEGYNIALHYNSSDYEAKKTQEIIQNLGVECDLFQCDLNDAEATAQLIPNIIKHFPNLKILVNSASIFKKCSFTDTSSDIFDRHMNINFKAPFILTQNFNNNTQNSIIINLLDTYITSNEGAYFAYLLSKKSLFELTKMSAKELAPNVRVNGICIGSLLTSQHWTQEDINRHTANLPLQSPPTIDDINKTLLYLIKSKFLTGQCIFVDSGQNIK